MSVTMTCAFALIASCKYFSTSQTQPQTITVKKKRDESNKQCTNIVPKLSINPPILQLNDDNDNSDDLLQSKPKRYHHEKSISPQKFNINDNTDEHEHQQEITTNLDFDDILKPLPSVYDISRSVSNTSTISSLSDNDYDYLSGQMSLSPILKANQVNKYNTNIPSISNSNNKPQKKKKIYKNLINNNYNEIRRLLILGYIHQIHELLSINPFIIIPELISNLISNFYYQKTEKFIKCSKNMKIFNDNNFVVIKKRNKWSTVYGDIVIDGNDIHPVSMEWTFKINELSLNGYIISIDSSYDLLKTYKRAFDRETNRKSINSNYYEIASNGEYKGKDINGEYNGFNFEWGLGQINDIINIKINTKTNQLQFKRFNDGNEGIHIFNNIDLNQQYRIALSIYGKNDCIQLIDFKQKQIFNMDE